MSEDPGTWRELVRRAVAPPFRDARFWVVQLLILAVVIGHLSVDIFVAALPFGMPDQVTAALFLVPIVYAALNFGLAGACASAAWGTLLMAPDLLVVDSTNDLWSDGTVLALVDLVAIVVGQRVERQLLAQRRMAAALEALRRSEARYRALFDNSSAAMLVVDGAGVLQEANPAATALFGPRVRPQRLGDLLGEPAARRILSGSQLELISLGAGPRVHRDLRPLAAWVPAPAGEDLLLVVLQDVTPEHEHQKRTEAYAALVLRLQEEERRRVAREIHDEPLQTLLYVLGRLAALEADAGVDAGVRAEAGRARSALSGAIANLSAIMRGLRPPVLDDLGLVAGLRSLARAVEDRSGIAGRVRVRGRPGALDPDIESALFRSAEEWLRDVERRGSRGPVSVTLAFRRRQVELLMEDGGPGREPEPEAAARRFRDMEGRAHLLGGSLEVEHAAGQGTRVRMSLRVHGRPPGTRSERALGPDQC